MAKTGLVFSDGFDSGDEAIASLSGPRWHRAVRPLLSTGWETNDRFAFVAPVGWVLHGVLAEGSSDSAGVYLWRVAMPLYQQATVVDLSWSVRHGGAATTFETGDEILRPVLAEAMSQVEVQAHRGSVLLDLPDDNIGTMEVRAYGLAVVRDWDGALRILDRVLRHEPKYDWQVTRHRCVAEMSRLIREGSRAEALKRILDWRSETLEALRIERHGRHLSVQGIIEP